MYSYAESMFRLYSDHTCGCVVASVLHSACLVRTTPPRGYIPYSIIHRLVATQFSQNHVRTYTAFVWYQGLFQGGGGGGAFAHPGNLVAAPRKHTTVIIILLLLLKREREREM